MSDNTDWEIPEEARPLPSDYQFDLDQALSSVVALRARIPEDAFTASILGTERGGNGVIIREDGLILTIGYLITEAETVWVTTAGGKALQAYPIGYDQTTGFGLVQVLGRVKLPALPAASARWRPASPASASSPDTGNTCWTRRCSPRRHTRTGAARL